ncbi:MAG: alpha-amylase family glycosyl hydrolase [Aristaeellaceae bacterium]
MSGNEKAMDRLRACAEGLYGGQAQECMAALQAVMDRYRGQLPCGNGERPEWCEQDVFLIAYGDMVRGQDAPLRELGAFVRRHAPGLFSCVHLLPFYPYSSDDGFAVMDYRRVDPALGDWEDVAALGRQTRLMFDWVGNHVSARSRWFQGYLAGEAAYQDYFIDDGAQMDTSRVMRPRTTPLLTAFRRADGTERRLWTTFSADQIDLNYRAIPLLCDMVDVMLFYVSKGAGVLRLDAANYMWKQSGTSCSSLPKTHLLIRLLRAVLDMTAPGVALITETNVCSGENLSYLGDGSNEAQMVYQFALPPLTVHAFMMEDARALTDWAGTLAFSPGVSYFNFLASHDGVGLMPAAGLLAQEELDAMVRLTQERGGQVSFKSAQGKEIPYELNATFYSLLADPEDTQALNVERFLTAHAILLALRGVPALYFHSLLGSENDQAGYARTGAKRSLNRRKFDREELEALLAQKDGREGRIFERLRELLTLRRAQPAFSPAADMRVLRLNPQVLALMRQAPRQRILALANVSRRQTMVEDAALRGARILAASPGSACRGEQCMLPPGGFAWLLCE